MSEYFKQEQWVDSEGRGIVSRTPHAEDGRITGPTVYFGSGNLQFAGGLQPLTVGFQFEIPGASVAEAFANLEAAFETGRQAAEANVRRQMEQAQRQAARQLVLPNGQMVPATNGHPRTR